MTFSVRKLKMMSSLAMLTTVCVGRVWNLKLIQDAALEKAVLSGIYYGMATAAAAVFIVDLAMANGMLQNKIRSLKVLTFMWVLGLVPLYQIKIPAGIAIIAALLVIDMKEDRTAIHVDNQNLPGKYLKRRPVKTLFELFFRLFPNPEPTGLYKIGNPKPTSLVFVTGNFELTVRRAVKALTGKDCWLLVCDSRGINIWCASEARHFGTDSIVAEIKRTRLSSMVVHRSIILPQLSASNVSLERIKAETGFSPVFGPLNIKNIDKYLENPEEGSIRKATFSIIERIEAAAASPILLVSLLLLIYNFIGLHHLAVILPAIYFYSLVQGIIFPKRIIFNVWLWALFYGGMTFVLDYLVLYSLLQADFWIDCVTISVGTAYLVLEFQGWSPLIKFSYIRYKKVEIAVDNGLCIGCGACMSVCPKAVFRMSGGKSSVVDGDACVSCKACVVQCPVKAVSHLTVKSNFHL